MVGITMKTLLSVLLLLPSLAYAEWKNWHPVNEKLFKSFVVLNVVDTYQTFDLIDKQRDPKFKALNLRETNSILGNEPSKVEVVLIKAALVGGAYYLLDKSYPTPLWPNSNKPKFVALAIMNMVYVDTVYKNRSIGLRMTYKF